MKVNDGGSAGTLFAVVILCVVTGLVVKDATDWRNQEVALLGHSVVNPALWGVWVFLFMLLFLPWYLIARSSAKKRLLRACPRCA